MSDLTKTELKAAKRCADMYDAAESMVVDLCQEIAQQCPQRGDESQNAWLKVALPKCDNHGNRTKYLHAGQVLVELVRRRSTFELPWTVAAELHPLLNEHPEWCFAKKRTRQEIRDFKRGLKLNSAAEAQALEPKVVQSQTEYPDPAPSQSSARDPLPTALQSLDASTFECEVVSDVQPDVDAYPDRCSETAVPLAPDELLAADWHRVQSSDKPDSYKRFHELLCQAEEILRTTHAHEWDGKDWYFSLCTLEGFVRHCKGCSAEYRATVEQRVQRGIKRAMEGVDC